MEVSITLEKACYFPGELLKCLVKVKRAAKSNSSSSSAAAAAAAGPDAALELLFECSGSERVDPSWVGRLYHPEVTAQKDNRRLVRSIFSTGQVPLLEGTANTGLPSSREFIVRCRLPNRLPPSYRGNAVRFLYQVVVRGRLVPPGAFLNSKSAKKQPAAAADAAADAALSCQSHASFVIWPQPDRSGLERRTSMPSGVTSLGGAAAGAAAGSSSVAAAAAAAAGREAERGAAGAAAAGSSLMEGLQDVEQIDYKLGMQALKLRWEEVILNPDGTRTLLTHEPTAALYPSSSTASQLMRAAQVCAFDSLQLEDQQGRQAAAAAAGGAGGGAADAEGGAGGGCVQRQLSLAQRASMSVRTFNLRAGEHQLVRVVLQPPTDALLQPGGTFGLLLDFRAAHGAAAVAGSARGSSTQPVCLQVVALLESEEVVLPPYAPARAAQGITAMRKLYAEQQEVTAHLLTTHCAFSIPLTAPPSFKTPMVCHKWVLRFELTLGKPKLNRPSEMTTEQLLWSLPLVVYPPLPQAQMGL